MRSAAQLGIGYYLQGCLPTPHQRTRLILVSSSNLLGSPKFGLSKRQSCGLHFLKIVG